MPSDRAPGFPKLNCRPDSDSMSVFCASAGNAARIRTNSVFRMGKRIADEPKVSSRATLSEAKGSRGTLWHVRRGSLDSLRSLGMTQGDHARCHPERP